MVSARDATVIGSGPNGLAAAIRLAQAGRTVKVFEAAPRPGGAVQSAQLTLPGFIHDPFAAVFPVAAASPFLSSLELQHRGLRWIEPGVPLAHPCDDGSAVILHRSVAETAAALGDDEGVYIQLVGPMVKDAYSLIPDLLAPPGKQRSPRALARFAQHAARSATGFASSHFHDERARALLAGNAAHSFLPLESPLTAGFGLFLGLLGHTTGWPIVAGGAGRLTDALVGVASSLGVEFTVNSPVTSIEDLPPSRLIFFDTSPLHLASIAGSRLPTRFRARLVRHRMGPAAFKIDFALSGPVPWTAPGCEAAGTVHVGGTMEEIALAEQEVSRGRIPERPFVIVSQPSRFDPTRAPGENHTLWAYCHVPANSSFDMTDRIEEQIERFAPGFRARVLARHVLGPRELEGLDANLVGGAINGGLQDLRTYVDWALARPSPYATPNPTIYRCSAATPPGGGVHGMAGCNAADDALRRQGGWRLYERASLSSV